MITITRRSPLTGKTNTMSLDISEGSLLAWKGGMLIQDAMPNLMTLTEQELTCIRTIILDAIEGSGFDVPDYADVALMQHFLSRATVYQKIVEELKV